MENRKSREKKTDMLRSIGKQSGESVESVHDSKIVVHYSRYAVRYLSIVRSISRL